MEIKKGKKKAGEMKKGRKGGGKKSSKAIAKKIAEETKQGVAEGAKLLGTIAHKLSKNPPTEIKK